MLETVLIPDVLTRTKQRTKREADETASLVIGLLVLLALLAMVIL